MSSNDSGIWGAEAENLRDDLLQVIHERDFWQDKADDLARAVGNYFDQDFGEHSNMNCPVESATEYLNDLTYMKLNRISEQ